MAADRAILHSFWLSSCSWRVRAALHAKRIPFEERAVDIVRECEQHSEQFKAINPAQKVPALIIGIKLRNKAQQECLKRRKYACLGSGYIFAAFAVETLGPWGPEAHHLFKEVSRRLVETSRDRRAGAYLAQRISIAIQRGNVASLLGTLPQDTDLGQIFYLYVCADGETLVESMAIVQYLEDTRPEPALSPSAPLLRARMREICETVVSGIQPLQNIGLKSHFDTEQQYVNFTKYWTDRGLQTLEDLLKKSAGCYCVGDQITLADICLVPQLYNAVTRHQLDIAKYPTVSKLYETLLNEELFQATHPNLLKPKK